MKREEMVCTNCLNCNGYFCMLNPTPMSFDDVDHPDEHRCAQGQWEEFVVKKKYKKMESWERRPYWKEDGEYTERVIRRWGEWDTKLETE
jgi:hypothetical protein